MDFKRSTANARERSALQTRRKIINPVYLLILVALPMVALAGCRRSSGGAPIDDKGDTPEIQLILEDAIDGKPVAGPHRMTITLRDGDGAPIEDAAVSLRADMNHAGMLPVEAEAVHQGDGVYSAAFDWTMAGDWIVTVIAKLADGRVKTTTHEVSVAAK